MDNEVKQRNRRRKRAQRMQAIRENKPDNNDSGEEEDAVKPQRPPARRKKSKEPFVEEDIIDGFAILGFKTYEDLETVLKIANKEKNVRHLAEIERPKHEPRAHITHHISVHPNHAVTITQDPATSDDSGRASERLTGSSVPPRDADSSRDRLSDASSRCSSGKGYICDSEGEDDKDTGGQEDVGQEGVEPPAEKEGKQETVDTPLTSPSDDPTVQGSDASSVIFASTPATRKRELPGALPPSLPLSNVTGNSPVPAPTPPNLPVPSPAPAQQPPSHPIAIATTTAATNHKISATLPSPQPPPVSVPVVSMPPASAMVPVTMPQPAAAPAVLHPPPLDSTAPGPNHARTDSPAVATSANVAAAPGQYHAPPYQPLYAPYAAGPYTSTHSPAVATTVTSAATAPVAAVPAAVATTPGHREAAASRPISPKGHSPTRERESYSSNVSSLSRGSVTPLSCAPPTTVSSSLALSKSWSGSTAPQLSTAPARPTPPLHSFPPPMFAAPLPPPVSAASPLSSTVQTPNPNPFSAENLFQSTKKTNSLSAHHRAFISDCTTPTSQDVHKYSQISSMSNPMTNQADMLRRELDTRFLASQDRSLPVAPPPYLRTEMHQHQHHHTHVHQHTTSLLPPPPSSGLFPSPLFKDIPKLGGVESPFYRQNLGINNYPGYTPSLLHPGLTTGPTPFVPPNHLPSFQPKPTAPDPAKPKTMKTGKWNAMHVRVAWEIYHHQQKGDTKPGTTKTELLRPPTHLFSPSVHHTRPHELPFPASLPPHRAPAFDQPHPGTLFTGPPSHIGSTMSPFTRYGGGFSTGSPFGVSPFASARDLPLSHLHDPWRGLQRTVPGFPPSVSLPPTLPGLGPPAPWTLKPDPILEQREREEREREQRERERLRREREERERREREEKQRRLEQQQQQERERERREKERREHERRELERERERERLMHHQQRYPPEPAKHHPQMIRDRSPMRNGTDPGEIRIKEEPRPKEEDLRYHPYLRHSAALHQNRVLAHGLAHYPPPPTSLYPHHAADPFYRYEPLRYNPLVDAAMRAEEERVKLFGGYGPPHHSQLRGKDPGLLLHKDPGLLHCRPGPGPGPPAAHKMCATPPTDLHKKEEPR